MKIRKGFVSNSSSSSFIIPKNFITDKEKQAIKELVENAKEGYFCENKESFYGKVHREEYEIISKLEEEFNLYLLEV